MNSKETTLINNQEKSIDVIKLCKDNQLDIVNFENIKTWNPVRRPSILRTGLELLGHFYSQNTSMNIIGWGTTESRFMDSMSDIELANHIEKIFENKPPLLICSNGVNERNKRIILEVANKKEVPIVFPNQSLSFTMSTLGIYIVEHFAEEAFVHGSLVVINGYGVMIIGDSGIGKSEAVLELIQKGHMFVTDDSVIIKRIGNNFIGYSPEITKNILEARGLGLIDIKAIYGEKIIKEKSNIDLVVELKYADKEEFDRLGNQNMYFEILGGKINKMVIPVHLGRNISSLIEVATNLSISKRNGTNAFETIEDRIGSKKNG